MSLLLLVFLLSSIKGMSQQRLLFSTSAKEESSPKSLLIKRFIGEIEIQERGCLCQGGEDSLQLNLQDRASYGWSFPTEKIFGSGIG